MSGKALTTITVTEQVITAIRDGILEGKYTPQKHMHEVTLAAELGVSRTPVRDALRVLASEELLTYYPNRGYVVRSVEQEDVLSAYDVRGVLEGLACRIVAERGMDEEEIAVFKAILERGDVIFSSSRWGSREKAAWRDLNTEFHYALVGASRNTHLDPLMRQIRSFPRMFDPRLDPRSDFFQNVHTRDERLRSHHDHIRIVDAMIRREGTRAEALMREHVYANRELLRHALEPKA